MKLSGMPLAGALLLLTSAALISAAPQAEVSLAETGTPFGSYLRSLMEKLKAPFKAFGSKERQLSRSRAFTYRNDRQFAQMQESWLRPLHPQYQSPARSRMSSPQPQYISSVTPPRVQKLVGGIKAMVAKTKAWFKSLFSKPPDASQRQQDVAIVQFSDLFPDRRRDIPVVRPIDSANRPNGQPSPSTASEAEIDQMPEIWRAESPAGSPMSIGTQESRFTPLGSLRGLPPRQEGMIRVLSNQGVGLQPSESPRESVGSSEEVPVPVDPRRLFRSTSLPNLRSPEGSALHLAPSLPGSIERTFGSYETPYRSAGGSFASDPSPNRLQEVPYRLTGTFGSPGLDAFAQKLARLKIKNEQTP